MFRFDLGLAGASGAGHFPPFDRLHVDIEVFYRENHRQLLRHRTLPEIRNPPPSTLHPPRYQTEKGVLELFKKSYYSGSGFQLLLRSHSEVKNSLFFDEGAQGHLYSGAHLHGSHVQSSQSHLGLEHLLMMNLFEF